MFLSWAADLLIAFLLDSLLAGRLVGSFVGWLACRLARWWLAGLGIGRLFGFGGRLVANLVSRLA